MITAPLIREASSPPSAFRILQVQLSLQALPLPSWAFSGAGVWENREKKKEGSPWLSGALRDPSLLFEPELEGFSWSSLCADAHIQVLCWLLEENDDKLSTNLMVLQILVLFPNYQLQFNFQSPQKSALYIMFKFLFVCFSCIHCGICRILYCTWNWKILSCLSHWITIGALVSAGRPILNY